MVLLFFIIKHIYEESEKLIYILRNNILTVDKLYLLLYNSKYNWAKGELY